jgi:Ca2+:H+ antiporter
LTRVADAVKIARALLAESILNWLLLGIPISVFLWLSHAPETLTFLVSAVALVPLAGLIGQATEDIAASTGPTAGGLLNVTFGNATELVVAVLALTHGLDEVVKASITGSILGNALLVLGMSMVAGGWGRERVYFNRTAASTAAATLLLAVTAMVMPAVFNLTVFGRLQGQDAALNLLSLLVAIVLLATYVLSLVFSLITHRTMLISVAAVTEEPMLSVRAAIVVLASVTLVTALESEILVSTIAGTTKALGITEFFVGAIVVAIVGNAAEHLSAVLVARKGQMDLAVSITTGSSTQIALFVAPILVLLSWAIGRPMSLVFNAFEIAAVALAGIIVTVASADGETNWFEGIQLIAVYLIFAIAFFFVPGP